MVGRVDAKAHRAQGLFEVKALHLQPGVRLEPDQVRVIDPLYGTGTIPRVQFERQWSGAAIHVEPR